MAVAPSYSRTVPHRRQCAATLLLHSSLPRLLVRISPCACKPAIHAPFTHLIFDRQRHSLSRFASSISPRVLARRLLPTSIARKLVRVLAHASCAVRFSLSFFLTSFSNHLIQLAIAIDVRLQLDVKSKRENRHNGNEKGC